MLWLKGEKVLAGEVFSHKRFNTSEFLETQKNILQLRSKFIAYFKSNGFDAILCPTLNTPAFDHGRGSDYFLFTKMCW